MKRFLSLFTKTDSGSGNPSDTMTLQGDNKKGKLVSIGNYKFTGRRLGKGNFAKVEEAVHSVLNVRVSTI